MKSVSYLCIAILGFISHELLAQQLSLHTESEKSEAPKLFAIVHWDKEIHDFGNIAQNSPVSVDFSFTNSGDTPMIITEVKTSCGCTATHYPKTPVQPGASASITVNYNAKSLGNFTKSVMVYANTEEGVKKLQIKGRVE
jgi:hypothetical protein